MVRAFFTGKLRNQYFSDVSALNDDIDGTTLIATGYMCLATSIGWGISFFAVLFLNPAHIEAQVLAVLGGFAAMHGFLQIRRRRDPRVVMNWLVFAFLGSVAIVSFRHSGIIAPVMASMPVTIGISALYLKHNLRRAAFLVAIIVLAFGFLTASGLIGIPTTYTPRNAAIMTMLTTLFSTIALGGIAWVAQLSRDYTVERLK